MRLRIGFGLIAVFLLFAVGSFATSFDLTIDNCTGGCGTPPFGTVTLTDLSPNEVGISVTLNSPNEFVATGFPGTFGFNIVGEPTISVDFNGGSSDWSLLSTQAGALHFDGFGKFMYAIVCVSCGNGGSTPIPGPLNFTVTATGLTADDFAVLSTIPPGSTQAFFVADIMGSTLNEAGARNTGPVGAVTESGGGPGVPEPTSSFLLGSGLLALALAAFRRRK